MSATSCGISADIGKQAIAKVNKKNKFSSFKDNKVKFCLTALTDNILYSFCIFFHFFVVPFLYKTEKKSSQK